MISFYEFSNLMESLQGGTSRPSLKDQLAARRAAQRAVPEPTVPEPTVPEPTATPEGKPLFSSQPLKPSKPRFAEPEQQTTTVRPYKPIDTTLDPLGFQHRSSPKAGGEQVHTDAPVMGINPSKQMIDKGAIHGHTNPSEPLFQYKQDPKLARAAKMLEPYIKEPSFSLGNVMDPNENNPNMIQQMCDLLNVLKSKNDVAFVIPRGDGQNVEVPKVTPDNMKVVRVDNVGKTIFRGDRTDLPTASPEAQKAADAETLISPRIKQSREPKQATATGPAAEVKRLIASLVNNTDPRPKLEKHQKTFREIEKRLAAMLQNDDEQAVTLDQEYRQAKRDLEKRAGKPPMREWIEYFDLMESYRPSSKR